MNKHKEQEKKIQDFLKDASLEEVNQVIDNFESHILSLNLDDLKLFYESLDKSRFQEFSNKIELKIMELQNNQLK